MAAGDGALRMDVTGPTWLMRKSSTSAPLGSTAWARTPAGALVTSANVIHGRYVRASARYTVTDKHVIWQRGRLRRSIERDAISYAVIRWNPRVPGVGGFAKLEEMTIDDFWVEAVMMLRLS